MIKFSSFLIFCYHHHHHYNDHHQLEVRQIEAVGQVGDLEGSISQYKSEYAMAIRDSETIRAERDIVGIYVYMICM
jgi:uncharacterized protein YjlB